MAVIKVAKSPTKKKRGKGRRKRRDDKEYVLDDRGNWVTVLALQYQNALDEVTAKLAAARKTMLEEMRTNEDLHESCAQQEKDAMEVIAAIKREAEKYADELCAQQQIIAEEQSAFEDTMDSLSEKYQRQIADIQAVIAEKDAQIKVSQEDLSLMKDFRLKRDELVKELEQLKTEIHENDRRHTEQITKMERRFFEEKVRLQKDANRKIQELAAKAHKEAVSKLEETTSMVQSENNRMAQALQHHLSESEQLHKASTGLSEGHKRLINKKALHDVIIKEKVQQMKTQAEKIKLLQSKIEAMEYTLSHIVREFECERETIGKVVKRELDDVRAQAAVVRENLQIRSLEMRQIRSLAQVVLDQRVDLETFFMDAMEFVRANIEKKHAEQRKAAQYDHTIALRRSRTRSPPGLAEPSMKTSLASILSKSSSQTTPGGTGSGMPVWRSSTSISWRKHPLLAADAGEDQQTPPTPVGEDEMPKLEFSDLDWESKENILRLLFAKMNGLVADEPPPGMVTPQQEANAAVSESGGSSGGGDPDDRALVPIDAGNVPAPAGSGIVVLTDDDDGPAAGPERHPGGLSLTEVAT